MEKKIALITGVTGQDGAYLARLLLNKNYKVYGLHRSASTVNAWRLEYLGITNHPDLSLICGDVTDFSSTLRIVEEVKPDEIYNLAAQSFVGASFEQPNSTAQSTAIGTLNLLEAIRCVDVCIKFYQASTSELYGKTVESPQSESTPFYPRSPYAVAKLYAHWITVNYRESYNIFAASGILFNHESPLRGISFVTRKITSAVARIKNGSDEILELGNIDAKRDWGHAEEYVEGMHLILQANKPDSYVLATGISTSVKHFIKLAFNAADVDIEIVGEAAEAKIFDKSSSKLLGQVNSAYFRPAEVDTLLGNPTKAADELGWRASISVEKLANDMVTEDLRRVEKGMPLI